MGIERDGGGRAACAVVVDELGECEIACGFDFGRSLGRGSLMLNANGDEPDEPGIGGTGSTSSPE